MSSIYRLVGILNVLLHLSPFHFCLAQSSRLLTSGLKKDRSALLALAESMDKTGTSRVGAWKARGNPCFPKPWPHVSCTSGRVTAIDLANLDLVGTLPPQLKRLNRLESLNMENNQIAGTIPEAWSDRQQFQRLRTLNLGNNVLSGTLPNRKWNRKNAFRSLEELNLAENRLTGGLPDGWLGSAKPFRKLKLLDLSDNQLGSIGIYRGTPATTNWCLITPPGVVATDGWCPTATTPPRDRLPVLEILDLSQNSMVGDLPTMWPQMFPNLQFLIMHNNQFWNAEFGIARPGDLPTEWTRRTVPRAFPQLQSLILYPGSINICSIPDGQGGFLELNGDLSYLIEDEDGMEFDGENPWFCPGPTTDNPPTADIVTPTAILTIAAGKLRITFTALSVAANDRVYGFRVSLYLQDPDTQEYEPVGPYTGKLYQVYPVLGAGINNAGTVYTIDTVDAASIDFYRVEISAYNLNTEESTSLVYTTE